MWPICVIFSPKKPFVIFLIKLTAFSIQKVCENMIQKLLFQVEDDKSANSLGIKSYFWNFSVRFALFLAETESY